MYDWDELFTQYTKIKKIQKKQKILSRLIDEFFSIEKKQDEALIIHRFEFNNQ